VKDTYHSNTIQNYGRSALGLDQGGNYNPTTYSDNYTGSKNSYERRTVRAEHPLKHFIDSMPTRFTLKRADISPNSVSEGGFDEKYSDAVEAEKQSHHSLHTHSRSSNRTAASLSNDNNEIATYLTPPQPQASSQDTLAQLQQLPPRKRHYSVRNEHNWVNILTTLHILPHPEEPDYF
jgi:hypothetical protein